MINEPQQIHPWQSTVPSTSSFLNGRLWSWRVCADNKGQPGCAEHFLSQTPNYLRGTLISLPISFIDEETEPEWKLPHLFVCIWKYAHPHIRSEKLLPGVISLLVSCGSLGSNSGCQDLPANAFTWPKNFGFAVILETVSQVTQAALKLARQGFLLLLSHVPRNGIAGVPHHEWFYIVMRVESKASCEPDKHSNNYIPVPPKNLNISLS